MTQSQQEPRTYVPFEVRIGNMSLFFVEDEEHNFYFEFFSFATALGVPLDEWLFEYQIAHAKAYDMKDFVVSPPVPGCSGSSTPCVPFSGMEYLAEELSAEYVKVSRGYRREHIEGNATGIIRNIPEIRAQCMSRDRTTDVLMHLVEEQRRGMAAITEKLDRISQALPDLLRHI